jgi:hypothetical protein
MPLLPLLPLQQTQIDGNTTKVKHLFAWNRPAVSLKCKEEI